MDKFLMSERYRLELKWNKAIYERDGVCRLDGAIFTGPVLQLGVVIKDNDSILLDFYRQYYSLVSSVYVGLFSWKTIEQGHKKIFLNDAYITHNTELNKVPQFKSSDYIVIDTEKHDSTTHDNNVVYDSYVVNETGMLYNFK